MGFSQLYNQRQKEMKPRKIKQVELEQRKMREAICMDLIVGCNHSCWICFESYSQDVAANDK